MTEPLPPEVLKARARWRYRGKQRPTFADPPGAGQESVWDYPRPPRVEPLQGTVRVACQLGVLARSERALRVLETASPPTVYLPYQDLRKDWLQPDTTTSICEWKGAARSWHLPSGTETIRDCAWDYPDPWAGFEALRDCLAFHPGRVACFLDGERVLPQPGGYYGGWISRTIAGPWKGAPGTEDW